MMYDYPSHCPKCKSRLYPGDDDAMRWAGVCSNCVSYDHTEDHRYQAAYRAGKAKEEAEYQKAERARRRRLTRSQANRGY